MIAEYSLAHLQAFEPPFTLTAAEGALTSVDPLVFPQAWSTLTGYRAQWAFIPANICVLWHNGMTDWKWFILDPRIKLPLTSSQTQHGCDHSGEVLVVCASRTFCCTRDTHCWTCALRCALPGTWVVGTPGCILNTSGHSCPSHAAACVWNGHIKPNYLFLQLKCMVNLSACLTPWKYWRIQSSGMWCHIKVR